MTFDEAFDILISPTHEGGYVNDLKDPGGETKYGISKRAYPRLNIPELTRDVVRQIVYKDYWLKASCDALPPLLRFPLLDFAYNSGVTPAIKSLQTLVGTTPDGIIGPHTLMCIANFDPFELSLRFQLERLLFLTTLANWPHSGKGWTRRVCRNLQMTIKEARS